MIRDLTQRLSVLEVCSEDELHERSCQDHIANKLGLLGLEFWRELNGAIHQHLQSTSVVVIRGLPFDEHDHLFVGLASTLGILLRHNSRVSGVVRDIVPRSGARPFDDVPHTDSSHWPRPNDITALQCVRPDQDGGGLSRIVPISEVLNQLGEHDTDTVETLQSQTIPFLLDRDFGNAGFHTQKVLTKTGDGDEKWMVRFCRIDTEECLKKYDVTVDQEVRKQLQRFENVCEDFGKKLEFSLAAGDWLLFDNYRVLHSKTPTQSHSNRLLKKIKLNLRHDGVSRGHIKNDS